MLAPGTQLGPYLVLAPLGAGAMGEVYRARDARLDRLVAVKTLPDAFASDTERLRRFEQEARAAGQLDHPNIVAIHDVGTHEGAPYVVEEFLDGQTLGDRLKDGALPVRRAVECAIQIAHGLAAAHAHGIVHRDLKPENVFLTRDGRVKILDFGLAKLTRPEGKSLKEGDSLAGSMTAVGLILGTAGYMAPEQVTGERADFRSDLFAVGAILFEMLTGRRAFKGSSAVETLHAILNEDPPAPSTLVRDVSPALDRIVQHCLEKHAEQRYQSAHDLGFHLEAVLEPSGAAAAPVRARPTRPRRRERWLWGAALGLVAIAAVALSRSLWTPPAAATRLMRFSIYPPEKGSLHVNPAFSAISPDGRMLAMIAADSTRRSRLWVRGLESVSPHSLAETDGAAYPFWSPDGRFIGFFAGGKLRKVPAGGGPVETLCDVDAARGGAWSRDGVIIFAPGRDGPLYRVMASGGEPTPATTLDTSRHESSHRFPCFLPDGRRFLYLALPVREGSYDIYVGSLGSQERKHLMTSSAAAVYVRPGYLLFARSERLLVQRFDSRELRLRGEPQPVGEAPANAGADGEPAASASGSGILAYSTTARPNTQLVWYDREGNPQEVLGIPPGRYEQVRLSPDGQRAVVERRNSLTDTDLWLVELSRGVAARLTYGPAQDIFAVWSPDGERLVFASNRAGAYDLYQKLASGGSGDEPLLASASITRYPMSWSQDGRFIVYEQSDPKSKTDLWVLPLSGQGNPAPYLQTPFNESAARLSPDGRWLAYGSDETGRSEVYVQSFPTPAIRHQISSGGGGEPWWHPDGRELAYVGADGVTVMSVEIQAAPTWRVSAPRPLLRRAREAVSVDLSPDGRRSLAIVPAGGGAPPSLTLVVNWMAALER